MRRSAAKQTYQNWELALLINVIYEKEEEGKQRSPRPSLASEGTRFSLSKRRFPFFAEKERDAKRAKEKEGRNDGYHSRSECSRKASQAPA